MYEVTHMNLHVKNSAKNMMRSWEEHSLRKLLNADLTLLSNLALLLWTLFQNGFFLAGGNIYQHVLMGAFAKETVRHYHKGAATFK